MNIANEHDRELIVLERILTLKEQVHQRDLAQIVGISLGMTNVIIKRLVSKGWLAIKKINNRNVRYIVSSKGIEEVAKRSYRYLKRTIENIVDCKEVIEELIKEIRKFGYTGIVIIGKSDIDFIIEHICDKNRLAFRVERADSSQFFDFEEESFFYLYCERHNHWIKKDKRENCAYLCEILT